MKKVLMILMNNFVNDARVFREAQTLGQNGYDVRIVSLHSEGLEEFEQYDFFALQRIKLTTRKRLSKTNRYIQLIKYYEFYRKCLKYAKKYRPDIVHCHDLSTLPVGVRLKKEIKCKLVYDSHELWPHSLMNKNFPRIMLKVRNMIEKKGATFSDRVIMVCESATNKLAEQYNLTQKPAVIRNVPENRAINQTDIFRRTFGIDKDAKIILYQGVIGKGRGLESIVNAMTLVDPNIVLVLLGSGSHGPELKKTAKELGVGQRVFLHDAVPNQVLLNYTASADLGLSLIENKCLSYFFALPNKLFEFIHAGLPVLCSDFPEMRRIVHDYGVGELVSPESQTEIAGTINKMFSETSKYERYRANTEKAKQELNWEKEQTVLLDIYRELRS